MHVLPSAFVTQAAFRWRPNYLSNKARGQVITKGVQIKAELEATLVGQGSTLRWTLGSLWRFQARS